MSVLYRDSGVRAPGLTSTKTILLKGGNRSIMFPRLRTRLLQYHDFNYFDFQSFAPITSPLPLSLFDLLTTACT